MQVKKGDFVKLPVDLVQVEFEDQLWIVNEVCDCTGCRDPKNIHGPLCSAFPLGLALESKSVKDRAVQTFYFSQATLKLVV